MPTLASTRLVMRVNFFEQNLMKTNPFIIYYLCMSVLSDTVHNLEPIELVFSFYWPDPQNVWISTLNIFNNTWWKTQIFWQFQKYISQIVITIFVNIQFVELKKKIENLHLKQTHKIHMTDISSNFPVPLVLMQNANQICGYVIFYMKYIRRK